MKRNNIFLLIILFLCTCVQISAQAVRVIDNKGTVKSINNNKVTTTNDGSEPINPVENDVWFDVLNNKILIYDDVDSWKNLTKDNSNNWSLIGNTGTNPSTNFLGTTDITDLVIKTNANDSGSKERIRIGQAIFPGQGEILINQATPNTSSDVYALIVRGNGQDVLRFENEDSNKFWNWDLDKNSGNLALNYQTTTTTSEPRIMFTSKGPVGIGIVNPAPNVRLDVNGKLKIRDIQNVGSISPDADLLFTEETGNVFNVRVVKKSPASLFVSDMSQTLTTGNEIATHKSNGTTTSILESITTINQSVTNNDNATTSLPPTAKTIATYKNEEGTNTNINETITRIEQVNGSANPPANPIYGQDKTADSPGDIKYYNENNPTTPTRVRVVSTDENNAIKIGSDGGAYYRGPRIAAAGKISSSGTIISQFNVSSVTRTSNGTFSVVFNDSLSNNYVIQLTVYDDNNTTVPVISYYNNTPSGFNVLIENTFGTNVNREFMFTIIDF